MLRHVLHDERIAQVGLVGPVFAHGFRIGNARPRRGRDRLAASELLERAAYHRLHRVEDVLLLDEAHFDVELVEFAGQAVGARVLIAKTGRDLEIAVEARHHQELLVLLGRLRQRVELARMDARRHKEVARPFGARRGEDRGLELEEPLPFHPPAKRVNDLTAQHDVLVKFLAPEIEEPVPEPRVLRIGLIAEHRQRQIAGRPQDFDLAEVNLDEAGGHFGVFGAGRTLAHLAVDADHEFRTQFLRFAKGWRIRIDHALGDPIMVAQIDEQQAAVIADAVAPAGKPNVGAILGEGQGAAGMGAVAVHGCRVFFRVGRRCAAA